MALSSPLVASWKPRDKDIKHYPHFDRRIAPHHLEHLANDPSAVVKHAFFPFLRYTDVWQPYRKNGAVPKKRPIRYSARRDAAIFAKYRSDISASYEIYLKNNGFSDSVIAYRKLKDKNGKSKTNIDFAKDAFDFVREIENCDCYVIDISSFFESLDHQYLHQMWETIKGGDLAPDEEAVFKAVTKYSVVDINPLFERLGLRWKIGADKVEIKEVKAKKRNTKKLGHVQICDHFEFMEKVCGKDRKYPSLIQRHRLQFGIPQGLPISDILANIYLIHFDHTVYEKVRAIGGLYMRYSDDIIVIVPSENNFDILTYLRAELSKCGSNLKIKDSKCSQIAFSKNGGNLSAKYVTGATGKTGLEYLGFRFDGMRVYIRERTTANLRRKFLRRTRGATAAYVRRFRQKSDTWLKANFYLEALVGRFVRELSFAEVDDPRDWTFFSYVRKAHYTFHDYETRFSNQLRFFKQWCREQVATELDERIASR